MNDRATREPTSVAEVREAMRENDGYPFSLLTAHAAIRLLLRELDDQQPRGWRATLYRWSVYWEMVGKQLRDRNAGAGLSLRERLRRGHRVGTCTSICLKGPPYRPARWMRQR